MAKVDYEFIRAWAEDLEATRAPQAKGHLSKKVGQRWGYCCLGRAEMVAGAKFVTDGEVKEFLQPDPLGGTTELLTTQTASRLGSSDNPTLRIPRPLRMKAHGHDRCFAAELNDEFEFTFREIAECIRYTWPKAFAEK